MLWSPFLSNHKALYHVLYTERERSVYKYAKPEDERFVHPPGQASRGMTGEVIGTGVAAVAAVASWISVYTNRQTADRALRAFVWPVISHRLDEAGRHILLVRLKNDGSGTAFNVGWFLRRPPVASEAVSSSSAVGRRTAHTRLPHDSFHCPTTAPKGSVTWISLPCPFGTSNVTKPRVSCPGPRVPA